MKDLYGICKADLDKLRRMNLIPDGALVSPYQANDETWYNVFFNTSEEQHQAQEACDGPCDIQWS